jgi:hypothetical protein
MEGAKSFTREEMFHNLDECSAEQLNALKKKSFWFNKEKCTDQFIDGLKMDLLNKANRPFVFDDDAGKKIVPPLLFEQFRKNQTDILLHNIEPTPLNLSRLYEWQPYESIQSFFDPIHYQISAATKKQTVVTRSLDRIFDLQNVLVASYREPTTFSTRDIIGQLEIFLDATLVELFLFTNAVIFMFDWSKQRDYVLLVAFKVDYKLEGHEYVSLERVNLFDDIIEESPHEMSKIRESMKKFNLSYHHHGFARR